MNSINVLNTQHKKPRIRQFFGRILQTTQHSIFVQKGVDYPTSMQLTQRMVNVQKERNLVQIKRQEWTQFVLLQKNRLHNVPLSMSRFLLILKDMKIILRYLMETEF